MTDNGTPPWTIQRHMFAEPLSDEQVDEMSDDALIQFDRKLYSKRLEERIAVRRMEILDAHAIPVDLFQVLRMLHNVETRQRIEELLVRVDIKAVEHQLAQIWYDEVKSRLRLCDEYGCRSVIPPGTGVGWDEFRLVCDECEQARISQLSRPPVNGLRSALGRARRARLPATLTPSEWQQTVDHYDDRCAFCGGSWCIVEHVTPISLGGGTTAANCLPACTRCNTAKSGKTLEMLQPLTSGHGRPIVRFSAERLLKATAWLRAHGRR